MSDPTPLLLSEAEETLVVDALTAAAGYIDAHDLADRFRNSDRRYRQSALAISIAQALAIFEKDEKDTD